MKFLKNLVVWFRKDPAPALCQYCKRLTKPGELVNGHPTHHGCLMAAAAVVDQALGAEVFDERAVPRVQDAFDALVLAGFSREAISALKARFAGLRSREAIERVLGDALVELADRLGPQSATLARVRVEATRGLAFLYAAERTPACAAPVPHPAVLN